MAGDRWEGAKLSRLRFHQARSGAASSSEETRGGGAARRGGLRRNEGCTVAHDTSRSSS